MLNNYGPVTYYVNMRHTYVYMQHNDVNIRGNMLTLFMLYINIIVLNVDKNILLACKIMLS